MSTNKKVLIGIGVALAICVCAAVVATVAVGTLGKKVAQSFKTDPQDVAVIARQVADYDVPAGYKEAMAMDLLVYKTVILSSVENPANAMIMLMQFQGDSMSQEQMEQQMQQAINQQFNQGGTTTSVIENRIFTIRGQEVTATISEGTNQQGGTVRQLIAAFDGKGGPTMLMIMGNAENWDEKMIEEFIASIE